MGMLMHRRRAEAKSSAPAVREEKPVEEKPKATKKAKKK